MQSKWAEIPSLDDAEAWKKMATRKQVNRLKLAIIL